MINNSIFSMHYAWMIWSIIFLSLWTILYVFYKAGRKQMLRVSLWTMPFGLTEVLFVPDYWNPPTLFDLAQRTGFDIESLIYTFAITGIASVLYQIVFRRIYEPLHPYQRHTIRHRIHRYILATPFVVFIFLSTLTNLNHIYCSIFAMAVGAIATFFCRPDLNLKIWVGGLLFLILYFVFFEILNALYPGYVVAVWNFKNISGFLFAGVPLEELLFGFVFGMYWSSVYEHLMWHRIRQVEQNNIQISSMQKFEGTS